MNFKRFTARTSRDALALVRQAFGDDAVVMSTRPCAEGVEVLAMAPESVLQLERVSASAEPARPVARGWKPNRNTAPRCDPSRGRASQRIPPAARAEARGEARREPTLEPQLKTAAWPKTWRRCR
jgi:flagellar biosynthesis protein FlhF